MPPATSAAALVMAAAVLWGVAVGTLTAIGSAPVFAGLGALLGGQRPGRLWWASTATVLAGLWLLLRMVRPHLDRRDLEPHRAADRGAARLAAAGRGGHRGRPVRRRAGDRRARPDRPVRRQSVSRPHTTPAADLQPFPGGRMSVGSTACDL